MSGLVEHIKTETEKKALFTFIPTKWVNVDLQLRTSRDLVEKAQKGNRGNGKIVSLKPGRVMNDQKIESRGEENRLDNGMININTDLTVHFRIHPSVDQGGAPGTKRVKV